jgi:hypothetical protein
MPDVKKTAKPKGPTKIVKAKPIAKFTAKAKVVKTAPKSEAKKPEVKAPVILKVKKARGPNKKAKGSFAELIKIQNQYEEAKRGAKSELRKEYDNLIKDSEKIKAQYKELFGEVIEGAPKAKGKTAAANRSGKKAFTLDQVQSYIDQTAQGKKVKIPGKNAVGVEKIKTAYDRAKEKDAESVLALLN